MSGALAEPVASLEVWPGCRHTVTRAEAAVLASPPFMRTRRLRQMGLAFHAWPNAENTRASHSLGVAYWSARYLEALRGSGDPFTLSALASAEAALAPLSLDLVVRLFGLVHDIDLLPLGHTLRYQSGLFEEAAGSPRLEACVSAIKVAAGVGLPGFGEHLDAAASAPGLAVELVNSGLGADLLDFAVRDSFAIARPQRLHDDLPAGLRLVPEGLALDVSDPSLAAARVAMADDLYRARFEVFAASVYHPVKLAADAMLDLVLRRLGPEACRSLLPEDVLIEMGDDELVDRLAAADPEVAGALQAGRLHEEVWREDDLDTFRRTAPDAERALSLEPAWRDEAESSLRSSSPWLEGADVIVAVSAPAMQAKPANARFVGADGTVFTLADASEYGFATAAAETAGRYAGLWSARVYVAPRWRSRSAEVAKAAAALLGGG